MEAKQSVGRKRKESPNHLSGSFTRSKSQIYSHLNRSGRFRSDAAAFTRFGQHCLLPNAVTDLFHTPRRTSKSLIPTAGEEDGEVRLSQTRMRDLRSRRVFSKPLVVVAEQEEEKKKPVVDCEVNPNLKFGDFGEELSWLRPHGEGDKADLEVNCEGGVLCENPNLMESGERLGFLKVDGLACNGQQLDELSPTVPNRDQVTDEENVQTTPPDPDIFATRQDDKIRLNGLQNDLQTEDNCTGIPSTGSPRVACGLESNLHSPNKKTYSVPGRKLVLNPCARLKVYKSPSSVSYRRLLPYLLGIAKDNSCALEIKSCPKIEIVSEEKPFMQSQVPLLRNSPIIMSGFEDKTIKPMLHSASEEMAGNGSVEEKFPSNMLAGDSTNQIPSNPTSTDSSSDNMCPTTVSTDRQIGMPSQSNSPQGDYSRVDQVSPAKSLSSALVSDSAVPVADVTSKAFQSCSSGDHTTNINTCEDAITVYQSTSPVEALPSAEPSTVSPTKGILKRNPRGCRGLCTCLNCASFRLRAERAFEFSRNQLQDTEEIVLGLMKELSQLRTALEMPLGDSKSQAASKVDQVKEVCASASKAEEVAKTRLKEMSEDVSVHCRIKCLQRPRVNFDIKAEEKGFEREKPV